MRRGNEKHDWHFLFSFLIYVLTLSTQDLGWWSSCNVKECCRQGKEGSGGLSEATLEGSAAACPIKEHRGQAGMLRSAPHWEPTSIEWPLFVPSVPLIVELHITLLLLQPLGNGRRACAVMGLLWSVKCHGDGRSLGYSRDKWPSIHRGLSPWRHSRNNWVLRSFLWLQLCAIIFHCLRGNRRKVVYST